jgi:hypothetical protein
VVSDNLEDKARALFEDSVERLDARTRSKLTQARNRALDEVQKGAARRRWIWAPAGGFAVAAVVAVGIVLSSGRTPPSPGPAALEDLEIVADSENLDLLQDQDVEFYAWLDEQ